MTDSAKKGTLGDKSVAASGNEHKNQSDMHFGGYENGDAGGTLCFQQGNCERLIGRKGNGEG